jgi:hypothetical protein
MAVSYVIDKKRRLVVTTCRDHLTFAQLQACQAQLLNDPDFNPDFKHLIDTTGITLMDVSVDEARPRHLRHGPLDGNTSRYGEAGGRSRHLPRHGVSPGWLGLDSLPE